MTSQRWQDLDRLFHSALERPPEERAGFLAEACGTDEVMRRKVEALVAAHEQSGEFLDAPAFEVASSKLTLEQPGSLVNRILGHYKILGTLGAGGMGQVYLAQDTRLGRKIALKLLPPEFTIDAKRVQRFEQEARAASALSHPNVCVIHEIGDTEDGRRFITMEYIEGTTLRQQLAQKGLKLMEALDVAAQVASGLAVAHAAGIVHRDIKPENVMLRHDGLVKVLDFGLAKLTQQTMETDTEALMRSMVETGSGMIMGTVAYMSPEQARGLAVDSRTDIWSLGVLLYEMVAGRAPFVGATPSDMLVSILERDPPIISRDTLEVPAELERIVRKALRKDREERYQVMKDLALDLKSLKQRLEFEADLERTTPPEERSGGQAAATAKAAAAQTSDRAVARTTSSAEYVINEIKRHKRGAALAVATFIIAAAALYFYFNRAPALTEKDTVLLADFVNTTGDAVFDGALKQALAVQLEQSPFLNIFPDQRVQETLRHMGRSPDERVTKDVAREICERQGIKAMLTGSIASIGSRYVIGLEAINVHTGDVIAREQAEAESKEEVLSILGRATTKLRGELGESLRSIEKFDAPIEQATTSSLEALKAYSLGVELNKRGEYLEMIPFFKRAVELDPNFAIAYARLSLGYYNSGQRGLAAEVARKAFELRERASEREKFYITSRYYSDATGEVEKAIEVYELWIKTYPRGDLPNTNLSRRYSEIGRFDKTIEQASEAIRRNPNISAAYLNLGQAFTRLNRFDEAREIHERAVSLKLDYIWIHYGLYNLAFIRGDMATMRQQIDWASGKPDEYFALGWQAETAAFVGQARKAHEFSSRAADMAMRRDVKEVAADFASAAAAREAVFGLCRQAKEDTAKALAIIRSNAALRNGAVAFALCGEVGQAQSLADELAEQNPKATLINAVWLPSIRAAIETHRNNPAQAIQQLQAPIPYEAAALFWPTYLRGQAYLRQRAGIEAAVEFQKILDHRGWDPTSSLYPLAHLGLARAASLTGDTATSRKAYQDFFALWKDADPDIPHLREAKQEYEKLR